MFWIVVSIARTDVCLDNVLNRWYSIRTMVKIWMCKRCGWEWASRRGTVYPQICPKCKSGAWDKERVRKKR